MRDAVSRLPSVSAGNWSHNFNVLVKALVYSVLVIISAV